MRIAVAGGTGTVGRHVVNELRARGHDAVVLSRGTGVDLLTGDGLAAALRGVAAVIDVSATSSVTTAASIRFFGTVTRNLLDSGRRNDVPHHVALSIVGAARLNTNYYAGKALQEQLLMREAGGWSLLRTTQFHEFATQTAQQGRVGPVQVVPTMRSQPIAASEVAVELAAIAAGEPRGLEPDLAGPREERMADMVRRYLAASRAGRPVWQVPLPGRWGRGMRDGSLLPTPGTRTGRQTFAEWLTESGR